MSSIFYFLFWAGLIFLLMRFGCGAHVMGHKAKPATTQNKDEKDSLAQNSQNLTWIAPTKDVDPVCGTQVDTKTAKPSVHKGSVYYLCSSECRDIFEASPEEFLSSDKLRLNSPDQGWSHV